MNNPDQHPARGETGKPVAANDSPDSFSAARVAAFDFTWQVVQMITRAALGIVISTWAVATFAHEPRAHDWKPEPLPLTTMIALNGYSCLEVILSTPLKKADSYEVVCKTGSGKSKAAYIFDAKTGKATPRDRAPLPSGSRP